MVAAIFLQNRFFKREIWRSTNLLAQKLAGLTHQNWQG